jgi:hypothetical protein
LLVAEREAAVRLVLVVEAPGEVAAWRLLYKVTNDLFLVMRETRPGGVATATM